MEIVDTVKQKREKLLEQFNSLQDKRVELEKQLKVVDQDILTFRGAILACNELIEENETNLLLLYQNDPMGLKG